MSNPNNTQTIPGNGISTGSAKQKKASRKASAAQTETASKRKAASEPGEILFKESPNPFTQPVPPYIWIDHPQDGERLQSPTYVIRLGVGGAESVELSIDQGPWLPCRLTSGYWWFDWSDVAPGKHTLVARMRTSDGRAFRTPQRRLEYRP